MIDLYKKSEKSETSEDLGNAIVQLIEDNLDFPKWNFKLSFKDFSKMSYQTVIYDSPYCRVSISFSRQRLPKYDELSIQYGRLHAPNEAAFMEWQGRECRCWHRRLDPLRFLDGLSPYESIMKDKMHKHSPKVVEEFYNSDIGIRLREEYTPEYTLVLESLVWRHYGQRFFDLFDLRQPEVWKKYQEFLREYYQLKDMKASYGPPYENVC